MVTLSNALLGCPVIFLNLRFVAKTLGDLNLPYGLVIVSVSLHNSFVYLR